MTVICPASLVSTAVVEIVRKRDRDILLGEQKPTQSCKMLYISNYFCVHLLICLHTRHVEARQNLKKK